MIWGYMEWSSGLRNLRCAIRFCMRRLSSGSITSAQSSVFGLDLDECFSELEGFLDGIFLCLLGGPVSASRSESGLGARRFLGPVGGNDGDLGAVIKMTGSRAGLVLGLSLVCSTARGSCRTWVFLGLSAPDL